MAWMASALFFIQRSRGQLSAGSADGGFAIVAVRVGHVEQSDGAPAAVLAPPVDVAAGGVAESWRAGIAGRLRLWRPGPQAAGGGRGPMARRESAAAAQGGTPVHPRMPDHCSGSRRARRIYRGWRRRRDGRPRRRSAPRAAVTGRSAQEGPQQKGLQGGSGITRRGKDPGSEAAARAGSWASAPECRDSRIAGAFPAGQTSAG